MDKRTQQRAQRRQGFVAGLAQGAGVAQYIPTGPGMLPRMAGAMVGRGARRVGRGAMGFMPMGGGLSTMLQALPGGGLAAGAFEAAQGMFQEAVGFSQARLENLPYAVLGGQRGINPRYAEAEEAVEIQKGLLTQAKDVRDARRLKRGQELTRRRKNAIRMINQKRALQKLQGGKAVGSVLFPGKKKISRDTSKTYRKLKKLLPKLRKHVPHKHFFQVPDLVSNLDLAHNRHSNYLGSTWELGAGYLVAETYCNSKSPWQHNAYTGSVLVRLVLSNVLISPVLVALGHLV
jgi:hypothetical protein